MEVINKYKGALTLKEVIDNFDNQLTSFFTTRDQNTANIICVNHVPITQWTLPNNMNKHTELSYPVSVGNGGFKLLSKIVNIDTAKGAGGTVNSIQDNYKISFNVRDSYNTLGYLVLNTSNLKYPKVLTAQQNLAKTEESYFTPVSDFRYIHNRYLRLQLNQRIRDLYHSIKSAYLSSYMNFIEPFDDNAAMFLDNVGDTSYANKIIEINGVNFVTATYQALHRVFKTTSTEIILQLCNSSNSYENFKGLIQTCRNNVAYFANNEFTDEQIYEKLIYFLKHNMVSNIELGHCYNDHITAKLNSNSSIGNRMAVPESVSDAIEYVPIMYKFHNIFNINYILFTEYVSCLKANQKFADEIFYPNNLRTYTPSPVKAFFINERIQYTIISNIDNSKISDTAAVYLTRSDVQQLVKQTGYLNNPVGSNNTAIDAMYWNYVFSYKDHEYLKSHIYNNPENYPFNKGDNYDYRCFLTRFMPYIAGQLDKYPVKQSVAQSAEQPAILPNYSGVINFDDIKYNVYVEVQSGSENTSNAFINHVTSNSFTEENRNLYVRKYFVYSSCGDNVKGNMTPIYRFIEKGFVTDSGYLRPVTLRYVKLVMEDVKSSGDMQALVNALSNKKNQSDLNAKTQVASGAIFNDTFKLYSHDDPILYDGESEFNDAEGYDDYFAMTNITKDKPMLPNPILYDEEESNKTDYEIIMSSFRTDSSGLDNRPDVPFLRDLNYTAYAELARCCRIVSNSLPAKSDIYAKASNVNKLVAWNSSNINDIALNPSAMENIIDSYVSNLELYYGK